MLLKNQLQGMSSDTLQANIGSRVTAQALRKLSRAANPDIALHAAIQEKLAAEEREAIGLAGQTNDPPPNGEIGNLLAENADLMRAVEDAIREHYEVIKPILALNRPVNENPATDQGFPTMSSSIGVSLSLQRVRLLDMLSSIRQITSLVAL